MVGTLSSWLCCYLLFIAFMLYCTYTAKKERNGEANPFEILFQEDFFQRFLWNNYVYCAVILACLESTIIELYSTKCDCKNKIKV